MKINTKRPRSTDHIRNKTARRLVRNTRKSLSWVKSKFESPAPSIVKQGVLRRWGGTQTWIETGTYLGETTRFLAKFSSTVISIEPEKTLASKAAEYLKRYSNVRIVNGTSEEILNSVLESLSESQGKDVTFWLGGHFSEGFTFLADKECPLIDELEIIHRHIANFQKTTILIDDVRELSPTGNIINGYPSLSYLVSWADSQRLAWTIEHDLFIMTNRVLH